MSDRIESLSDRYNTSREIVAAILDLAVTSRDFDAIWSDPREGESVFVENAALAAANDNDTDLPLYWGETPVGTTIAAVPSGTGALVTVRIGASEVTGECSREEGDSIDCWVGSEVMEFINAHNLLERDEFFARNLAAEVAAVAR